MDTRTGKLYDRLIDAPEEAKAFLMQVATCNLTPYARKKMRVGRNHSCPCGSGKKFKKCCQRKTP